MLACLRRCSRITPFIVALVFACPLLISLRSESVELLRGTEPRFLDLEARLLICGLVSLRTLPEGCSEISAVGMSRIDGSESGGLSVMGAAGVREW